MSNCVEKQIYVLSFKGLEDHEGFDPIGAFDTIHKAKLAAIEDFKALHDLAIAGDPLPDGYFHTHPPAWGESSEQVGVWEWHQMDEPDLRTRTEIESIYRIDRVRLNSLVSHPRFRL